NVTNCMLKNINKNKIGTDFMPNQVIVPRISPTNPMIANAIKVAVVLGALKLKYNTSFIKYTYVKTPTNAVTIVMAICPNDAIIRCCIAMLLLDLNEKNSNTEIILETFQTGINIKNGPLPSA